MTSIQIKNNDLLTIIDNNINNKIPSSFIRKGDGENIIIGYRMISDIKLRKYLKMLRIMNIRYSHISFQKYIRKELISAFNNCDYLGIAPENHRHGSWRFEEKILKKFNFSTAQYCDMNFHFKFIKIPGEDKLKSDIAEKIISNKNVGVISCFNIEQFLQKYNSNVSCFYNLVKQRNRNPLYKITSETYQNIFELIKENHNVDFWIVAAGIHAKIFCNYIKINNGIAIDIGSSIDTWNDVYNNRGHLRNIYDEYTN